MTSPNAKRTESGHPTEVIHLPNVGVRAVPEEFPFQCHIWVGIGLLSGVVKEWIIFKGANASTKQFFITLSRSSIVTNVNSNLVTHEGNRGLNQLLPAKVRRQHFPFASGAGV